MAAVSAPPSERTRSASSQPTTPSNATERLLSLDVFRGLTMLLLISHGFGIHEAFQNNASLAWLADQFEHRAWAGCTLWDLIQPAFTFIVGVAIPLSTARRMAQGATRSELLRHVLWRAAFLIVLSNLLSNWNTTQGLKFQLINVLCQIALGYVVCFAVMQLPFRMQALTAAGLMVFHHALFYLFPGPDGPFSQSGNIGAVLDAKLLGYNYSGYYTTLNFLGNSITILFGVWTGMLLGHYREHAQRLKVLLACAASCFALGLLLANWIPMVKRLWLGSFTFFSAGWVLLAFATCYWLIECKGWRKATFPAVVVGMNCIFIYSFSQVLRGWLARGVGNFPGKFAFLGDAGAIPLNLIVMAIMWYLCYWLYQRKIFFKI
jgi:heparan-alpha-glucosaminide N-acetyltransferase